MVVKWARQMLILVANIVYLKIMVFFRISQCASQISEISLSSSEMGGSLNMPVNQPCRLTINNDSDPCQHIQIFMQQL